MIGKSFAEIEKELGRLITDDEFDTVVQTDNCRTILIEGKIYEYKIE